MNLTGIKTTIFAIWIELLVVIWKLEGQCDHEFLLVILSLIVMMVGLFRMSDNNV